MSATDHYHVTVLPQGLGEGHSPPPRWQLSFEGALGAGRARFLVEEPHAVSLPDWRKLAAGSHSIQFEARPAPRGAAAAAAPAPARARITAEDGWVTFAREGGDLGDSLSLRVPHGLVGPPLEAALDRAAELGLPFATPRGRAFCGCGAQGSGSTRCSFCHHGHGPGPRGARARL